MNYSQISAKFGNSYDKTIEEKQYYRLLTYSFVHCAAVPYIANMYAFYNLVNFIERFQNIYVIIVIYVATAILTGLCSISFYSNKDKDDEYRFGAAGAVAVLLGISLYLMFVRNVSEWTFFEMSYKAILPMIVSAMSQYTDHVGFIFGLMIGGILGAIL